MTELLRVLYINGGIMSRGGIESYMMNYYRHIDRNKIQIDFVVHGNDKGVYDDEITQLGGKIYHVPVKSVDMNGNKDALEIIFKSGKYQIVHSHMDAMSYVPLKIAKKCGVPIRIAHSHNTKHMTNNHLKLLLNDYAKFCLPKVANHYFACSKEAGIWLFGKQNSEKVEVIPNAIDISKFTWNSSHNQAIREKLGIPGDSKVYGHIGRIDYQKNHPFLLHVFSEISKQSPNSHFLLIGDGADKEKMMQLANELNIKNVHWIPACPDVNQYYSAMDLFMLPSHFEGLPVVLIEATANGLPCIASTNVPNETNIAGNILFKSLENSYKEWADAAIEKANQRRIDYSVALKKAGYDITLQAELLQNKYFHLIETIEK